MPDPSSIRVAVIGASGYTGEELLRILARHGRVTLSAVTSRQQDGQSVAEATGIEGLPEGIRFENLAPDELAKRADIFFLALPHGVAAEFALPLADAGRTVIDLSADFRLRDAQIYKEFYGIDHPAPDRLPGALYALPEWTRDEISQHRLLACPGCYPTSVLLPLLPLLRDGVISGDDIVINSLSGISGAGKKAENYYSFCERADNATAYGIPKHRHLSEMEQELSVRAGHPITLTFTPHLLPVVRGMLSTISAPIAAGADEEAARNALSSAYANEPFVRLLTGARMPETRRVVHSNVCEIALRLDPRSRRLQIVSAIDNLVKGASGQAVQVMNLAAGLPETTGLLR